MAREAAVSRLIVRALTRPVNVLAGAAVVAAGVATGIWPLLLAGVAVYGVLVMTTLRDPGEARRALGRPPRAAAAASAPLAPPEGVTDPGILGRWGEARAEYGALRAAMAGSPVTLPEVEIETAGLMEDLGRLCRRAQSVRRYLDSVDEDRLRSERARAQAERVDAPPGVAAALDETIAALDQQLSTIGEMRDRLRAFDARMRQVTSSLGAMRGEIATLEVESQHDGAERIAGQVHGARTAVTELTASLERAGGAG